MRHLDSRLIEGLLDEMAADSLLRIAGGAREGKDAETTGTLDFIIRCESTRVKENLAPLTHHECSAENTSHCLCTSHLAAGP